MTPRGWGFEVMGPAGGNGLGQYLRYVDFCWPVPCPVLRCGANSQQTTCATHRGPLHKFCARRKKEHRKGANDNRSTGTERRRCALGWKVRQETSSVSLCQP